MLQVHNDRRRTVDIRSRLGFPMRYGRLVDSHLAHSVTMICPIGLRRTMEVLKSAREVFSLRWRHASVLRLPLDPIDTSLICKIWFGMTNESLQRSPKGRCLLK